MALKGNLEQDTLLDLIKSIGDEEMNGRLLVRSGGKVQVESKKDIHKRIGRSTDDADAVIQAFWPGSRHWYLS